jgi:hypothetical protein
MSFELPKPKEQRLKRLEEEKSACELSISNFNFCYKMPSRGIDSDEEVEQKGGSQPAHCYSVNFEDDDDVKSPKSAKSRRATHRNLYERLTEKVQGKMELVEGLILQYNQHEVTIDRVKKVLDGVRVVTRDPYFEFDDFHILKNFDQELARDGLFSYPISCNDSTSLIFNNISSLAKLDIDLESQTHTLKKLLKVKDTEMICSMTLGTGPLSSSILVSGVIDNSIVFLDTKSESVLFRVPLDPSSSSKTPVSAINSGKTLWVLFEDWSLEKYDVITSYPD